MGVGGTLLLGFGIVLMVLVTNGRWDSVWAAALGTNPVNGSQPGASSGYTGPDLSNAAGDSYGEYTPGLTSTYTAPETPASPYANNIRAGGSQVGGTVFTSPGTGRHIL